jgi:cysteine desulfurase
MKRVIYLDNAATTCADKRAARAAERFSTEDYGNASSIHFKGRKAFEEMEKARKKIAAFINADAEEIIFTSGGTESNNVAILGLADANPDKKHIITSVIEHPSVLEPIKKLENRGYSVDYVRVDSNGIVDVAEIEKKIKKDTLIVSIMHVNNEIGTIQPIEKIAGLCRKKKVIFHTDAVQSFAKLNANVKKMKIDLMSASGHKINAQKGIGFLYARKEVKIRPLFFGGGQEHKMRSGTENLPGIASLAAALEIKRNARVRKSRDKLLKEILQIQGSRLNGSAEERIYNNINVSFYGIEGESLALLLDKKGICVSTGSACSSHKLEESHVLKAIGVDDLYIHGSLRITLDSIKPLSDKDIKFVAKTIKESVDKLREISPFKYESKK